MAREKLREFLGNPGKTSISYSIKSEGEVVRGNDLGDDPNTGLPLISENDGLTGNFLEFQTKNNQYKVKGNNQVRDSYKREDNIDKNYHDAFVNQPNQDLNTSINTYSNSGLLETENLKISDFLNKNGHSDKTGHELYSSISGKRLSKANSVITNSDEDHPVLNLTKEQRNQNNRFAAGKNAFFPDGLNLRNFETPKRDAGTYLLQEDMASFNKDSNYKVGFENLKKVGASVLLKMGGWDNSQKPSESLDPKTANLKNLDQPSVFVNNSAIKFQNAHGAPSNSQGDSPKSNKDRRITEREKSYSTFYNDKFRFENIENANLLRIKTVIAMRTLVKIIVQYFESLRGYSLGKYNGPGPHAYGKYKSSANAVIDVIESQMLVYTEYGYINSIEAGLSLFFGIKKLDSDLKTREESIEESNYLSETKTFWLSVAHSFLRRYESIDLFNVKKYDSKISKDMSTTFVQTFDSIKRNGILNLMNTLATMGDILLRSTGGKGTLQAVRNTTKPFDVDQLDDLPGHRVSKSRKKLGLTTLDRSLNNQELPSSYLLPTNVIKAAVKLDNIFTGQNPAKGMLGSTLVDKTYLGKDLDGSFNKIPLSVVHELEDRLEGEYFPLYIQDLRTNEVIAFHGFVTELSDSFSTEYESTTGYGRMDSVHHLKATSRSVSMSLSMFATNKKDYDEMWYKINKITTLIYPQWTQGEILKNSKGGRFVQPMSQVIGATPVIRLRVGDVIKSNYSRFNLARTFGIGDIDIVTKHSKNSQPETSTDDRSVFKKFLQGDSALNDYLMTAFLALYGSPTSFLQTKPKQAPFAKFAIGAADELSKQFLVNGFANPVGVNLVLRQLTSPDHAANDDIFFNGSGVDKFKKLGKFLKNPSSTALSSGMQNGYNMGQVLKLKPATGKSYSFTSAKGRKIRIYPTHEIDVIVIGIRDKALPNKNKNTSTVKNTKIGATVSEKNEKRPGVFRGNKRTNFSRDKIIYEVLVINDPDNFLTAGTFEIYHEDLLPNYSAIFNRSVAPLLATTDLRSAGRSAVKHVAKNVAARFNVSADMSGKLVNKLFKNSPAAFMEPENNPITRAFETSMGRGLAGVMTDLKIDVFNDDFAWETDFNSRAPTGVNISFGLNVIHDIPPGLDHSGYNRAPIYNVGSIMEHVSGDPNNRIENAKKSFKDSNLGHARRFKRNK